ncbi:MAG: T9SS type A sorting domain-containing protein, partial [Ignavibacteria bacterium]
MKNLKLLLVCFFIKAFYTTCISQQWISTYNGVTGLDNLGEDKAYAIAADLLGYTYVTGYSTGNGSGYDYATIKYDSYGDTVWVARYNGLGNGDDVALDIVVDNSGYIYVTGYSMGIGTGYDYATIKYNSDGDSLWVVRFDGEGHSEDKAYAITVDEIGEIHITGCVTGIGSGTDYCTIKYDSNGEVIWNKVYNGTGNSEDVSCGIKVDVSRNVYVTGYSTESGSNKDYTTIKYDSSGATLWVAVYNGPGNHEDKANSITLDNEGNILVTGTSRNTSSSSSQDYATVKYDTGGVQQWAARYNGTGNSVDIAYAVAIGNDNEVLVTGSSRSSWYSSSSDYATVKYNSNGVQQWVSRYNGTGNSVDIAYAIAVSLTDDAVFVTGSSRSTLLEGSEDMVTVKYSLSSGTQLQVSRINGPGDGEDAALDIIVDDNNNVSITGYVSVGGLDNITQPDYDYATLRYAEGELINTISNNVPEGYKLYQNYPNPFNPSTTISFMLPKSDHVILKVFDAKGQEIATLLNQRKAAGNYQVTFDAGNLSSGVYYY